jgi:hypothetical protein
MKKNNCCKLLFVSLMCLSIVSCTSTCKKTVDSTDNSYRIPALTKTDVATSEDYLPITPTSTKTYPLVVVDKEVATSTKLSSSVTPKPTGSPTATIVQLVLPSVTMSPKELEKALLKLLRTNGNCTGKCIAGIQPDKMNVQEAVEVMTQWGTVRVSENSQGKTYIVLDQAPLQGQTAVYLSVGSWTREFETIDHVLLRLQAVSEWYISEDLWFENYNNWQGYSLEGILDAYGKPSYVGYYFSTNVEVGESLIGRTISYGMEIQYDHYNMTVLIGAIGNYNGETLFICPSWDPHYLVIEINPEVSLQHLQEVFPVTWQDLTDTDLEEFIDVFTIQKNKTDDCIETSLDQIEALQLDFH